MKISFLLNFHTLWGQKICVTGSIPELGAWQTTFAKEMNYAGDGNWRLSIDVEPDTETLEYHYFLTTDNQRASEEWGKNHLLRLEQQTHIYILYDCWQARPANAAFYSSAFTESLFTHPRNTDVRSIGSQKKITIKVFAPRIEKNQSLCITGNRESLGNWQPEKALTLRYDAGAEWHIDLDAEDISYPVEYKFLVLDAETRELLYWEAGENRTLLLPPQEKGETICLSGLYFRDELPPWKCTGSVIPVFSLRSADSCGTGDLADLRLFIDWVGKTGQRVIQVLPVNDTTATHTWTDSYPYSAISIYALHPMYISLLWLGRLNDDAQASSFEARRKELNGLQEIDYEAVMSCKTAYCRIFFEQEGKHWLESEAFGEFFASNEHWLTSYAAYSYLRDKYQTTDSSKWGEYAVYSKTCVQNLCERDSEAWPEIAFTFFLQFVLHTQFKAVSDYARANGIVLKGDLPIGVNRNSVEVWMEPQYFNMNGQAGAPPDDFSADGQNWHFPTYNWDSMEKDHFTWWKKRFAKLSDYFDSFRIDHILGFFRIWEIPPDYTGGLCGHFNPALPLSKEDIEDYGICFNESRFTTPHINRQYLGELFGESADEVCNTYLAQSSSQHFVLKSFCNTQAKIEALFNGKTTADELRKKNGLLHIANEVLFLRDPYRKDLFHPRISAAHSCLYRELDNPDRYAFDHLYRDFFYRRHNDFWKAQACKRLTPLIVSTQMLVCGEDLGMIPDSVPEVMNELQILSLEIERMAKTPDREFADLGSLPYLSVCTTSTHDMAPLRSWWKEDREKTQRYYNQALQLPGEAPGECTSAIALRILENNLNAPSMLAIIPFQDWLAIDDDLKRKDCDAERINVPSHAIHYWRYRMHITIEELLGASHLNEKISSLIKNSGRM